MWVNIRGRPWFKIWLHLYGFRVTWLPLPTLCDCTFHMTNFYCIGFHFSLLLISNFLYKKKRIEKSHLCPNSLLHNELCIPYSMSNFILLQAFHFLEFNLLFLLFFHLTTFIRPTHKKLYLFHVILGVEQGFDSKTK